MKLRSIFLAFSLCSSVAITAHSPHWSLNNTANGWNTNAIVRSYFHNSELQRQWAWEMMEKHPLNGSEYILDFGCGDGKISAELSRLVPKGGVTGIDMSSEMLHFAQIKFPAYAFPRLEFKQTTSMNFDDVIGNKNYDVITAFCVFHLIPKPSEILKNLQAHLKPDGKLLLVIPAGKNPAFFAAADEVFEKYRLNAPWKNHTGKPPALTMRTLDGCRTFLEEAGYAITSLELIDTDTPFYDKEELVAWMVGTTSANWNIPHFLSQLFFQDLVERMCELDPEIIDSEGRVHFKLSRIHAVAVLKN